MKSKEFIKRQTDGTMAVSAATPAGMITGEQLARIAELVTQGKGVAKLTSAQSILIFTSQSQVSSVQASLAEVGLALKPAGDTVRNIKACPGKLCKYANQDSLQDALALDPIFAGRDMHNKVKISLSGCQKNCMEALSNDIGFIGTPEGYQLYIGGRGGRRQALGILLREVVKREELASVIEEILGKYTAAGNWRERISHVVEKQGLEVFK
jgi:NAD(P)H-nitrite reductase large subunit